MTTFPNSLRLLKGGILLLDPNNRSVVPRKRACCAREVCLKVTSGETIKREAPLAGMKGWNL